MLNSRVIRLGFFVEDMLHLANQPAHPVTSTGFLLKISKRSGYCYDAATCQTWVAVYMLVLGLFSAFLGPARARSPMFDRLQCRNNSHGHF